MSPSPKVPRSVAQGNGFGAFAVFLETARDGKEGFHLTLFFEGRSPVVLYLRPAQVNELVQAAQNSVLSDQQVWDIVAKIPLEPMLPNRFIGAKLRHLLLDFAGPIQDEIARQQALRPPLQPEPQSGDPEGGAPPPGANFPTGGLL